MAAAAEGDSASGSDDAAAIAPRRSRRSHVFIDDEAEEGDEHVEDETDAEYDDEIVLREESGGEVVAIGDIGLEGMRPKRAAVADDEVKAALDRVVRRRAAQAARAAALADEQQHIPPPPSQPRGRRLVTAPNGGARARLRRNDYR